jgi:hypothetical protein
MATKHPTKPRRALLQEASDPATDPERLRHLVDHEDVEDAVLRAAWKNPSLPEDVWRETLLRGEPEAWANPVAPIYLLTWTSASEEEENDLPNSARWATEALWEAPERCSPEGKVLLAAKVQEFWATSKYYTDAMMGFLGWWAQAKGDGSAEHREVVRITILCVRTVRFEMEPGLTDEDCEALDLLEAWAAGGQDRRDEAEDLAHLQVISDTVQFAQDPSHGPENALFELRETVLGGQKVTDFERAEAEYERQMTDLIRRARPLPPVVD